jgi:hypothetical protein
VVFSSYEVKERAPYLGETRLTMILATSLAEEAATETNGE